MNKLSLRFAIFLCIAGSIQSQASSSLKCQVDKIDGSIQAIEVPVTTKDQAIPDKEIEFEGKKISAVKLQGGLVMIWGSLSLNTYGDILAGSSPIVLTQESDRFQCWIEKK